MTHIVCYLLAPTRVTRQQSGLQIDLSRASLGTSRQGVPRHLHEVCQLSSGPVLRRGQRTQGLIWSWGLNRPSLSPQFPRHPTPRERPVSKNEVDDPEEWRLT